MAQQAMARGITDSLSPYMFGSAEAEMQRRFTGGENLANRQYGAGSQWADTFNQASENQAARQFGAGENYANRVYQSGENMANRLFTGGESLANRQFEGGENALTRGLTSYQSERDRQMQALGLSPTIEQARYAPANAMMDIGAMNENLSQRELQDSINRFNFDQTIDQQKLADYMGLISGNYGGTGTENRYGQVTTK